MAPRFPATERYRLISPLGEGGMGRVWLARDEVLHRDVAVKEVVPPAGLTESEGEQASVRGLREARAIARLNHPNVVRIYDVVAKERWPWIVMEYVRAGNLQERIAQVGPLPIPEVAQIGLGILGALHAAHQAGVLHRDVKPSNVLLAEDRVVLTDFGLATMAGDATLTRSGLILGSPAYIAPERARQGVTGPESDLWSLGATLYAAAEGRAPYQRSTAMATLTALVTEPPDPAMLSGPLQPVLDGLLDKNPATRMRAPEVARLLRRLVGPTPRTEAAPWRASRSRRAPWRGEPAAPLPGPPVPAAPPPPARSTPAGRPVPPAPVSATRPLLPPPRGVARPPAGAAPVAQPPVAEPPVAEPPVAEPPVAEPPVVPQPRSGAASPIRASSPAGGEPADSAPAGSAPAPAEPAPAEPAPTPAGAERARRGPAEGEPDEPEQDAAEHDEPEQDLAELVEPEQDAAELVEPEPIGFAPADPASDPARVGRSELVDGGPPTERLDADPSAVEPPTAPVVAAPSRTAPAAATMDGARSGPRTIAGAPVAGARPLAARLTRTTVLVAAGGLVIVLIVAIVLGLGLRGPSRHTSAGAPAGLRPSSASQAASQASSPTSSPSTAAVAPPDGPVLPAGWHPYHDQTGFTVAVPDGWTLSRSGSIVYFRDPSGGRLLGIDQTDQPKSDPVADWTTQSQYRVSHGDFPGYQQIKIVAVDYHVKAADWEFTYDKNGVRTHVINRGAVFGPRQAYGFYWSTSDADWLANLPAFNLITSTFQGKP